MNDIQNIIDLSVERKKRFNPALNAIKIICTLEETLEDVPIEDHPSVLKEFITSMELGKNPITVLATLCRDNTNIFELIVGILADITPDAQTRLLDYVERLYPADKDAIHRLKSIIVTLHSRNLSLEKVGKLFSDLESWLLNYILGEDMRFEQYALMSNANIIKFPNAPRRLHIIV